MMGRFEDALIVYDKAIKIDPKNAQAYAYKGEISAR